MSRRLLVLVMLFAVVFAAMYAVSSAIGSSLGVVSYVVAAIVVGFVWVVARDVRRRPWSSESQRGQDVAYTAAAIAALHVSGQAGSDHPPSIDSGFGDGGAGGL